VLHLITSCVAPRIRLGQHRGAVEQLRSASLAAAGAFPFLPVLLLTLFPEFVV
jgi:hypothetical protein